MSLRSRLRLDSSLGDRGWQFPIVLPALMAGVLVVGLAVQSVRTVQVHRRVVENALHDYAGFAAWQYTRRASDYLRLVLTATLPFPAATSRSLTSVACPPASPHATRAQACLFSIPVVGKFACEWRDGSLRITRNETAFPNEAVQRGIETVLARAGLSAFRIGLGSIVTGTDQHLFGYWLGVSDAGRITTCEAAVLAPGALVPVFEHVAAFSPLLPQTFVGTLPNDSLVSIRVLGASGETLAAIGEPTAGVSASDVLGPELADLRVVATLHPASTRRLIAGGIPASNTPALVAMLAVTLVLSAVAVLQLRRTQDLIRLRSDFVASVSHELKTPLTQISLFADTLLAPKDRSADDRRHYLTVISREAKRLGQLVDSILHFALMTRGSDVASSRESSVLGEEIREAAAAFEPIAAARSVHVVTHVDPEIALPLERDAFRQLMLNVLDNALKFGPDGQTIGVSTSIDGDMAVIHVDDAGSGVPPAERERVFEAFTRAAAGGHTAGSGIGLAVVRDIVRRHGGRVRITDSPTGGARLEIALPGATVLTGELAATDVR